MSDTLSCSVTDIPSLVGAQTRRHRIPPDPAAGFDYAHLPEPAQRQARGLAGAIHDLLGSRLVTRSGVEVVQIGLWLKAVHKQVGRRFFQGWLAAEFQWRQPAASKFTRSAAVFHGVDCLDKFQPSSLYVLSRRNVRSGALAEALETARAGQYVTKSLAEAIVRKHSGISAELFSAGAACLALEEALDQIEPLFHPRHRPALERLGQRLTAALAVVSRLQHSADLPKSSPENSEENSPGIISGINPGVPS